MRALRLNIPAHISSVIGMRRALLIVPFLLIACGNDEEIKKKVAATQQTCDDQASKAKQAAQQKLDRLAEAIDQLKTDAADAKTNSTSGTSKAQVQRRRAGQERGGRARRGAPSLQRGRASRARRHQQGR